MPARIFLRASLAAALLCLTLYAPASAQIITTLAGTDPVYRAFSGAATNAPVGIVYSVAVGPDGTVYGVDFTSNVIFAVSPGGNISVVAGTGTAGYSGDGGPATQAQVNQPESIRVDAAGNLYIADSFNYRIRKISNGIITTIAGTGTSGFSGDGGPATQAKISVPYSLALDPAGNVYIGDEGNRRIRKITPGGTITTIAGTGGSGDTGDGGPATSATIATIDGLAFDPATGFIYVSERGSNRIRRFKEGGTISTYAGTGASGFSGDGGPATAATFSLPEGIALDASGNLYIADYSLSRIRMVNATTGVITTVAGATQSGVTFFGGYAGDGGAATAAYLGNPEDVAIDSSGNLYIADQNNYRIRKVSNGTISTYAGGNYRFGGDGNPATSALLNGARQLATDAAGNVYVADSTNNRIRKIDTSGNISTFAGTGGGFETGDGGAAGNAQFGVPSGLTFDSSGALYVSDANGDKLRKIGNGIVSTIAGSGTGGFAGDGGPAISAQWATPYAVIPDGKSGFYVTDFNNRRVRQVTAAGTISTVAGNGSTTFSGDGGPATSAGLFPFGLAVDAAGSLYISDASNNRIRKVSNGTITTFAGTGASGLNGDGGPASSATLSVPLGMTFDSAGNLYVCVAGALRKINPQGIISRVAGTGTPGTTGDGGSPLNAQIGCYFVTLDAAGNIYISDGSYRVRKITPAAVVPVISVAPATLTLTVQQGSVATSILQVTSNPTGASFQATAATTSGGTWLSASPGAGITPASITVIANAASLAPGTYQGTVTIQSTTVNVSLTVTAASAPPSSSTIYSYRGNPFTSAQSPYTTSNFVTGYFTAPTLAANLNAANITASVTNFAFTDGVNRLDPSTAASFETRIVVSTDSAGKITAWDVTLVQNVAAPNNYAMFTCSGITTFFNSCPNGPFDEGYERNGAVVAQNQSNPGSWLATPVGPLTAPATLKLQAGSAPQIVAISNSSGTSLGYTALAGTVNGGNWLSVSPASGSVGAFGSTPLTVSVNATGLATGVYMGTISINGGGITISVELLVPPSAAVMIVGQTGLVLNALAGATYSPTQKVYIANAGTGTMAWQGTVVRGTGLIVSPNNAADIVGAGTYDVLTVQANTTGLVPGSYYGLIRVSANNNGNPPAANSPQFISTVLNVLPSGSPSPLRIYPQALIFSGAAGAPSAQLVAFDTGSAPLVAATAAVTTQSGGNWLSADASGIANGAITVTANATGLAAGLYTGTVTIVPSNGSPSQDVAVSLVVPASSGAAAEGFRGAAAANCTPSKLVLAMRQLANSFSSPVGWPVNLEAYLSDDCGNASSGATIVATFSNGDPALSLPSLGNGLYSATWKPSNALATTVTVRASSGSLTPAVLVLTGSVGANTAPPPVVGTGGVVNAASFAPGADLAPGSIVSVFGTNLGTANTNASTFPLPTTLANITLTIGGIDAPLFFSSTGQVNAQIPVELMPGTQSQVVARAIPASGPELEAVPELIIVGAAHPGIFTTNGTQGAILNVANQLIDATHPAVGGDVIVIFATGLGAVTPAAATGQPPASGLAVVQPTVTIGGASAAIQYAGVAPGFVGLYQVNAVVPSGLGTNTAAPVIISQNGVASNAGTIAVH